MAYQVVFDLVALTGSRSLFGEHGVPGRFRFGRPNGLPIPLFRGLPVVAVVDLVALTGSRSLKLS